MIPKHLDQENYLHIVGKIHQPAWPSSSMERAWEIFLDSIDFIHQDSDLKSFGFVMMRNHYHWLVSHNLEKDPYLFDWFHELLTVSHLSSTPTYTPLKFEGPPHIVFIKNWSHYAEVYRYVYFNPVASGICEKAEHYPFSSLPHILGRKDLGIRILDNMNLVLDPKTMLDWINSSDKGQKQYFGSGLRQLQKRTYSKS